MTVIGDANQRWKEGLTGIVPAAEMSAWHPDWMDDPEFKREFAAHQKRMARIESLTGWMRRVPYIGSLVHTFWFCLFAEGLYQTMKPRWGALTFSFLNDGMKPTLWHTWRSITHDQLDPYTGIYTGKEGAPSSLRQAQEWEAGYRRKRDEAAQ